MKNGLKKIINAFYGMSNTDTSDCIYYLVKSEFGLFIFYMLNKDTQILTNPKLSDLLISKIGFMPYKILLMLLMLILVDSTYKTLSALFRNLYFQCLRYKYEKKESNGQNH